MIRSASPEERTGKEEEIAQSVRKGLLLCGKGEGKCLCVGRLGK